MKIIRTAKQFQKTLERERLRGRSIGFIPTMGALHAGHLTLVQAAKNKNHVVAVSIFVNPTQFGPREDFKKYPRVLAQDSKLLKKAGVDYLFYPSVNEMYPMAEALSIQFHPQASYVKGLCGRFRLGHFQGVATVVAKLFNLSGACHAYFGAKDFQQTVVIKHLVNDMHFPIQIEVCATLREKDGLAMSSRNQYLNRDERLRSAEIFKVLFALKQSLKNVGSADMDLKPLKKQAILHLEGKKLSVQYLEIVNPETLVPLTKIQSKMLVAVACFCGKTRLIDNVIIRP